VVAAVAFVGSTAVDPSAGFSDTGAEERSLLAFAERELCFLEDLEGVVWEVEEEEEEEEEEGGG